MSADGSYSGFASAAQRAAAERAKAAAEALAKALVARMTHGTPEEFANADKQHPHVFRRGDAGLFAVDDLAVLAGIQRDGKTFALTGFAAALRAGVNVGGMAPSVPGHATLFVTAEDSREQMLAKIAACAEAAEQRNRGAGEAVRSGLFVLDLNDDIFARSRALVQSKNRQPQVGEIVEPLCEAIMRAQRMRGDFRFGMVVFETASTLNDCDESNLPLRLLADAARRVARHCGLATVLSHHLSQAAAQNVRDLNLSTADIRGGTALVANSRQNVVLVNLGSDRFAFSESDKRTLLRRIVDDASPTHERGHRVVVLVPLDASKAATPPPIYLRQYVNDYGPALLPIPTPDVLAPMSWQEQVAYLRASSAHTRETGKAAAREAAMWDVIEAVRALEAERTPVTVNAVSKRCEHSSDWALPHLNAAVNARRLTSQKQAVPRCKGLVDVYSTPRDSSAPEESGEGSS